MPGHRRTCPNTPNRLDVVCRDIKTLSCRAAAIALEAQRRHRITPGLGIDQLLQRRRQLRVGLGRRWPPGTQVPDPPSPTPPSVQSPQPQGAVRHVDALIWSPARIGADVADGVREYLGDTEAVELILDIMRNASNKVAVAVGADAPRVEHGRERYLIGADGQQVFG